MSLSKRILSLALGLCLVGMVSGQALATENVSFKEKWRPVIEKYLGENFANKVLGEKEITLPKIPEIKIDARTVATGNTENPYAKVLVAEDEKKYNIAFLQELFAAVRPNAPTEQEFVALANVLEQGGTREGVYRSLVLDQSYAELEKDKNPPSKALVEFTQKYMQTYFNLEFKTQNLEKLNLYEIKRICVEKTLEMVDVLTARPNDLFDWYAVLSSDLAGNYKSLWTAGKIRGQTDKKIHQRWASRVPYQHIKSELIIKLHTVFNAVGKM